MRKIVFFMLIICSIMVSMCRDDKNINKREKGNNGTNDKNHAKALIEANPSDSFFIEANKIPQLEKEALQGSPDAAFKLYKYYEMYLEDFNKSFYWVTIAAKK